MRLGKGLAATALLAGLLVATPGSPAYAATITVTTPNDTTGGPDCSLRDAITAANTDTATGGCSAGSGSDVISFAMSGTITLYGALPSISGATVIQGGGAITLDGENTYGVLDIDPSATVTLAELTITGGRADIGGGIQNSGTLTIVDSTITGNLAIDGGGIYNSGTATVVNSTLADNNGEGSGGGIYNSGTATIANSTVVGNTASAFGGGIANNSFDATLTLANVTITGNDSASGGGVSNLGDVDGANVIVAGNTGGDHVSGGALQTSIVGVPSGLTLDDILVPGGPADNGGPTRTIALKPTASNPAIGEGNQFVCAAPPVSGVDQRGLPRPATSCDIGAYELQVDVTGVSPATGPAAGGTAVTITGAGFLDGATVWFGGTAATGVTYVSATEITATSPGGTGTVDVTVVNPDTQYGTKTDAFTYVAPLPPIPPPAVSAPVVVNQPVNVTVAVGGTASFTSTATGVPAPTVQWQISSDGGATWSDISGATSTTLNLTGATSEQNESRFRAVFSNSAGAAASDAATLTVTSSTTPPPVEPATVTVLSPKSGSPISANGYFGVTASTTNVGMGAIAYLTLNGSAKAQTLVDTNGIARFEKVPAENGDYAVRIGGPGSITVSDPFRLTILPFGITDHLPLPVPAGTPPQVQFTVATGNWSPGTVIALTRDGRATAAVKVGAKGAPVTLTVPARPGRYQVRVDSRQGWVYGDHAGVVTLS